MARLSGMDPDITLCDLQVHIEKVSVDITANSVATQIKVMPDDDLAAIGEFNSTERASPANRAGGPCSLTSKTRTLPHAVFCQDRDR